MQDTSTNSPASDIAVKLAKVSAPPIQQQPEQQKRPGYQRAQSCFIGAPSLNVDSTTSSNKNNAAITQDDIDAHNRDNDDLSRSGHNESCELFISKATRQTLDSMHVSQVESARTAYARVKLIRKQSGINPKDLGKYSRELSSRSLIKRASNGDNNGGNNDDANNGGHRRFSISMKTLVTQFESFVGFDEKDSDDLSDDDSDEPDDKEAGGDLERHCKSMGELDKPSFKPVTRTPSQLEEVHDIANKTLQGMLKRNSMKKQQVEDDTVAATGEEDDAIETNKANDAVSKEEELTVVKVSPPGRQSMPQSFEPTVHHPSPRRRTVESRMTIVPQRPIALSKSQQGAWKPLSSDQQDHKHDDEEKECEPDNEKSEDRMDEKARVKGKRRISRLWNTLTSSFTKETNHQSNDIQQPKKRSASSYFRRGKKKAEKCQFLQAVALYNYALIRQREELGKNHIDCGNTLNEIGVCWMMLGERYPALTALEEALYIRKKKLGDGPKKVADTIAIAETTANILMIFQEEREDMEDMEYMVEEGDGKKGEY